MIRGKRQFRILLYQRGYERYEEIGTLIRGLLLEKFMIAFQFVEDSEIRSNRVCLVVEA